MLKTVYLRLETTTRQNKTITKAVEDINQLSETQTSLTVNQSQLIEAQAEFDKEIKFLKQSETAQNEKLGIH